MAVMLATLVLSQEEQSTSKETWQCTSCIKFGGRKHSKHQCAGLAPQPPRNLASEHKYIALVSGLAAGEPSVDAPRLLLLLDWLRGALGDTSRCQRLARLVVCGVRPDESLACVPCMSMAFLALLWPSCVALVGSTLTHCFNLHHETGGRLPKTSQMSPNEPCIPDFSSGTEPSVCTASTDNLKPHHHLRCTPGCDRQRNVTEMQMCLVTGGTLGSSDAIATAATASMEQLFSMEAAYTVDRFLAEMASALPVDVMPGPNDLSSHALPQQPLHRCLFPVAFRYDSFCRVTNPYQFSVDGIHFLGTSGQNVDDVRRCVLLNLLPHDWKHSTKHRHIRFPAISKMSLSSPCSV